MAINRDQLNQLYGQFLGRGLGDADIQALGGENGAWTRMTPDQFVTQVIQPSSEYVRRSNTLAQNLYQPTYGQLDRAETNANDSYGSLISQLQDQAGKINNNVFGDFARRGLSRSSGATNEVARQQGLLNGNITSANQNLASVKADLAAQRANAALAQANAAQSFYFQPVQNYQANLNQQQQGALTSKNLADQLASQSNANNTNVVNSLLGIYGTPGLTEDQYNKLLQQLGVF